MTGRHLVILLFFIVITDLVSIILNILRFWRTYSNTVWLYKHRYLLGIQYPKTIKQ